MICKNYKFKYKETVDDTEYNIIWVELYSDSITEPITVDFSTVDGFPSSYPYETVKACAGSVLYDVTSGNIYVADEGGTFSLMAECSGGGGGGYTLPQATADALGGVKASPATTEQTEDVGIGTDGKLKTKPSGFPEPSSTDEGAFMTVENGVPAWTALTNRAEVGA